MLANSRRWEALRVRPTRRVQVAAWLALVTDAGLIALMIAVGPQVPRDDFWRYLTWGGVPGVVAAAAGCCALALIWVALTGSAFRSLDRPRLGVLAAAVALTVIAALPGLLVLVGCALLVVVACWLGSAMASQ